MDINVNINVEGGEPKVSIDKGPVIKRKKRKLKNGEETILEMPNTVESEGNQNILKLMGI